jgi:hypothetical protein
LLGKGIFWEIGQIGQIGQKDQIGQKGQKGSKRVSWGLASTFEMAEAKYEKETVSKVKSRFI